MVNMRILDPPYKTKYKTTQTIRPDTEHYIEYDSTLSPLLLSHTLQCCGTPTPALARISACIFTPLLQSTTCGWHGGNDTGRLTPRAGNDREQTIKKRHHYTRAETLHTRRDKVFEWRHDSSLKYDMWPARRPRHNMTHTTSWQRQRENRRLKNGITHTHTHVQT